MFGIGWPELLIIGIVAVLVIGPKDLPPLMRQIGAWSRKARGLFDEFRQHWDDLPNQVGLDDMQREADELQKKTYKKFGVDPNAPKPPPDDEPGNG